MELKRILARDSRSANEKAIQLYGPDVLIISSQKLDHQTELIVAVDLDAQVQPAQTAGVAQPQTQEDVLGRESTFVPFSKLFQSASAFAPLEPEEAPVLNDRMVVPDNPPIAKPWAAVDSGQALHESQRSQEIVEMMRSEMAALRKEFSLSRQMQTWQDGLRLSPAVQHLAQAMSDAAVPTGLRGLLTDSIQMLDDSAKAITVMHELLLNALARAQMEAPVTGVHALCGPSGAGKTAMVGRLAFAAAQLSGPDHQVMVSFADQRPGAWSQMQMLASQAGVACYRAVDSVMLQALLGDLEGKTVWIDTSGADFLGQAELLSRHHPKVLRHAVLPVDATVTSVQKILHPTQITWTSLMLSKWDEAASPWALLKGLTENPLPVSCVAGDVRISQPVSGFDPSRLVSLALLPFESGAETSLSVPVAFLPEGGSEPLHRVRAKKSVADAPAKTPVKAKAPTKSVVSMLPKTDDFLIPTLMSAPPAPRARSRAAHSSAALKVVNG